MVRSFHELPLLMTPKQLADARARELYTAKHRRRADSGGQG